MVIYALNQHLRFWLPIHRGSFVTVYRLIIIFSFDVRPIIVGEVVLVCLSC